MDEELNNEQVQEESNGASTVEVMESMNKLSATTVVDDVEQNLLNRVKERTNFQERSEEVITKAFNAELERREIIVLDQAQKNELAKLKLKLNKKTMKEEAKAEQYEKRRKAMMLRYGYLYEPYEVELIDPKTNQVVKETRYKNFTTNVFINKFKEFANFWANLADGTKSIIKKTIKIIFWGALLTGIGFGLYAIIKWIINSSVATRILEAGEHIAHLIKF